MAEPTRKPEPDKTKKARSLGSFLLFFFVLLVILAYVSQMRQGREAQELSHDQFLWHLYLGEVESLTILDEGTRKNEIQGRFDGDKPFVVRLSDTAKDAGLFRAVKAERHDRSVRDAELLLALESGWCRPVAARILSATADAPKPRAIGAAGEAPTLAPIAGTGAGTDAGRGAGAGGDPGPAAAEPARPRVDQVVQVEVEARSFAEVEAEARQGSSASGAPEWEHAPTAAYLLPDRPGNVWLDLEVEPDTDLAAVSARLEERGVAPERLSFDVTPGGGTNYRNSDSSLAQFLTWLVPAAILVLFIVLFMRQVRAQGGAGGVMNFGRSRAQLYTKENRTNVTFDDVAGVEEAKSEVRELVEFLKSPARFTRIGARIPRGILLVGPPGCGKTLLAKAIAGEAEVPFFSISGSDFVEMFVGVGASRVRDLFKQARDNSPCIIFLDEIDAVGRRRGSGLGGGHDEREQTLNAILVEMDGFGTDEGIIVIAATNRPDVLDPALLRPGRFDREVVIEMPDMESRHAILDVHLAKVKADAAIDLGKLARSTPGYSGADLAAIVNEAAIMAVLDKREQVNMDDLDEARDKVRYGRQKRSRKVEEEDRRITAIHESGHAVVAASIAEVDPPHKVTIVPRGRSLGATMILPERESYHMHRRRLLGMLAWGFGGRAAEAEIVGDVSAGAADDIRRATETARAMVTELGMSDAIGPINYAERSGSDFLGTELLRGKLHSEDMAGQIDAEVKRMLDGAYQRALAIVREHRAVVEEMTRSLLAYETLGAEDVRRLMAGSKTEELRPAHAAPAPRPAASAPAPGPAVDRALPPRQSELPGAPGLAPA
jgi:cell division protease FtsH